MTTKLPAGSNFARLCRRTRALLIVLTGFVILRASAADSEAAKKDLAQLQGEWTMVSGSSDGHPLPPELLKLMKRVCQGDETTSWMGGQIYFKAKLTLDPSQKPKTIDFQMTEGVTKGKTQLGIYELDGDTLKSCFAAPGAERPTDFASKPNDGRTLSVWKLNRGGTAAPERK